MSGADEESKVETQDTIVDINEPVSRSDFLKKLVAGGAISVAAITGLGGLEKAFGQSATGGGGAGTPSVEDLVMAVQKLTTQLNNLQTQFNGLINGTIPASKFVVNELDVSDIVAYKEKGLTLSTDALYMKSQNSDFDYQKLGVGDNYFLKLDGIDGVTAVKLNTLDVATYKENNGLTLSTDSLYLKSQNSEFDYSKLGVGDNYFLKLDGIDGVTTVKLNTLDVATYKENNGLTLSTDTLYVKMANSDLADVKSGVTDNFFLKLDGVDGLVTDKITSTDISAHKIVATDVVSEKIQTSEITVENQNNSDSNN